MKRLLEKVEKEEEDNESNAEEFERKLTDIMKRYKIHNDALTSELVNLHRDLREWSPSYKNIPFYILYSSLSLFLRELSAKQQYQHSNFG